MRKQNVYAEFLAIHFALDNIGEFFKRQFNLPKEIAIFSDLSLVSKLNANKRVTRNKVINIIVEQINEKMEQFHDHFPQVRLQINAMDKEQKRYNPYYKAAHNAARKAIKPLS